MIKTEKYKVEYRQPRGLNLKNGCIYKQAGRIYFKCPCGCKTPITIRMKLRGIKSVGETFVRNITSVNGKVSFEPSIRLHGKPCYSNFSILANEVDWFN